MKLLISNIILGLDDGQKELELLVAKKLKLKQGSIRNIKIFKQSIDARKKPGIRLVYSISCEVNENIRIPASTDIKILETLKEESLVPGDKQISGRPLIIGTGPAGIFCGLILAQNGYKPIIIDRGGNVEERTKKVQRYWEYGELDTETNVQFGEGGAGTFSDGKLTTRINDSRCDKVLQEYHNFGAPDEILYKAKPHIGTDILKNVVSNIRREIERLGGTVLFNTKAVDLNIRDGKVCGVLTDSHSNIDTNVVVMAIGHSARDTFQMLYNKGVPFLQKPFSIDRKSVV